jgi:hypothetical protein
VRRSVVRLVCALALSIGLGAGRAAAQTTPPPPPAGAPAPSGAPQGPPPPLRVFLDCDECDDDYVHENVGFVDYVLDRAVADLHVLVTTQSTGGGGLAWTVKFIGLARLQGQDRTMPFNTSATATSDDQRKEFVRVFKLGLVTYAFDSAAAGQLDVRWTKPQGAGTPGGASQTTSKKDPWNFWVFRVSTNGNMNGEKSSHSSSYSESFSANRTTERWKLSFGANGNVNKNTFDVDEDTTVKSRTSSWNVNELVVKSLGPKWSLGMNGAVSHSSFSNVDRSISFAPGIEYDVFPYKESTRRSLTFEYAAGLVNYKYADLTVFDKLEETVPRHYAIAQLNLRQPWGSLTVFSTFSQQLNHIARYRESVYGEADVRLFKGFSFNVFAEYDKIADQISLKKEEATEAEVLLRLQQLQTSYSYFINFGITYRFGSIFNNIVNPRFNSIF